MTALGLRGPICGALLALPTGALAGDGRIEVNQRSILAAGGFPYAITSPGSYVLTSDLNVAPAGASGIQIQASDVSLDLNGFAIRGAHVCSQVTCLFGAGRGVEFVGAGVERTRLVGGSVRGFGLECVRLGADALVEGVVVSSCGDAGIAVGDRGLLVGNHVSFCGVNGLRLTATSAYGQNAISLADLGFGSGAAVTGGGRGIGNVCDGGSCPGARRRFYLSLAPFTGANADAAGNCAPGYHFASLWEIHDVSALEYDTTLGLVQADSGAGPPLFGGWVRTGNVSSPAGAPGQANCAGWTSSAIADSGSAAALHNEWTLAAEQVSPWAGGAPACNLPFRIWCVEN